jgi:hypothetical protein
MKATTTRANILAPGSSRRIIGGWIRLLAGQATFLPPNDIGSTEPSKGALIDRTLRRHALTDVTPHKIPLPFTWRDVANRGLALLTSHPDAILTKDQQDRLRHVFVKLLQEDARDGYMVWEDFRNIDGSKPLSNHDHWLETIVRHLRSVLRVRNLFGPEIPDDNLLMVFGRWDDSVTRTLRNINLVVTAAQPVAGTNVALPPVWRTAFSLFARLIATDRQILSCYCSYWKALPWPHDSARSIEKALVI